MKQIIVLVATIVLGIAIGGFIIGFSDDAEELANNTSSSISAFAQDLENI